MSAQIRLSSKLAADPDTNGLDAWRQNLVTDPDRILVAVVWLDTPKITIDTETRDEIPTVRVRRIEPIGFVGPGGNVPPALVELVHAAEVARTGRVALPFEDIEPGAADIDDDDPEY